MPGKRDTERRFGHGSSGLIAGGAATRIGALLIIFGVLVITSPLLFALAGNAFMQRAQQAELMRWLPEVAAPAAAAPPPVWPARAPNSQIATVPFLLKIPRIGLRWLIYEGTGTEDLRRHGAGHINGTVLPGQPGVAGIAGHRTTYGAPFYLLNRLRAGDAVIIQTPTGHLVYRVYRQMEVPPTRVDILRRQSAESVLVLISCSPPYSARSRLAVFARLDPSGGSTSDHTEDRG